MKKVVVVMGLGLTLLVGSGAVGADEPSSAALKAEIELLKSRLSSLEQRLSTRSPATSTGQSTVSLPSGLQGVQMSGFVDTSYTYNLNEPNNRTSGFRVFDTRAEDFMINKAELVVEKPVSNESPVGFRTDLDFGQDSEVVGAVTTGLGSGSDEFDLQQAYAEYLAPVGNGLDVKVGKFVTSHGAEVIESKDNWNFSRSFLFGYAIPFTHTGLRTSYPVSDWLTARAGLSNGWDVVDDNNKGKTLEFGADLAPMEGLSFGGTYMFGAE